MALNRVRERQSPSFPFPEMELLVHAGSNPDYVHSRYAGANGRWTSERIEDEQGPKSLQVRPCLHRRVETLNSGFQAPGWFDGTYHWTPTGPLGINYSVHPNNLSSGSGIVSSFNRRSIRGIVDEIPTKVDVPTNLFEISDIPRTIKSIFSLSEYGPKTFGSLSRAFETRRISLGKTAADHWLAYSFGIKPLVSDILNSFEAFDGVDRRLQELKSTHGKITKFRKGGSFTRQSTSDFVTNSAVGYPFPQVQTRFVQRSRTVMRAGGSFYHELQGLYDASKKIEALKSAYGFDNLYSSLWNIKSFSFLADYFTNIGELLGELKSNDVYGGDITLMGTWSTVRTVTQSSCEARMLLPQGGYSTPSVCSFSTIMDFERTAGIPTTLGLVFDTSLNATQIANIAALAT